MKNRFLPSVLHSWLSWIALAAAIAFTLCVGTVRAAEPVPGNLWAWGESDEGVLGYAGNITAGCPDACQLTPTFAAPFTGFIEVSGGNYFSIGLKADGTVWVWGYNPDGELALGYADLSVSYAPLQVAGLTGVVHVAAGAKHALALKSDGTVWAWGSDLYGETGTRRAKQCFGTHCVPTPTQVLGPKGFGHLSGVAQIKAGVFASIALKSDGTVWGWGANAYGNLGNGSTTDAPYPTQTVGVHGLGKLSQVVAIGLGSQSNHVLALLSDATVVGWGDNHTEQLGQSCTNSPFCQYSSPIKIAGISGAVAVTTGYDTSFAVLGNGSAMALGDNGSGGLGIGFTANNLCGFCVQVPTTIPGLANVVDIAAGANIVFTSPMALEADGSVKQVSTASGTFVALPQPTSVQAIGIGGTQMLAISTEKQAVVTTFTPLQIGFPNTAIGTSSAPFGLTVGNIGTQPLVLSSVQATDASPNENTFSSEFTVPGATFPLTVPAGGSATVPVVFTPVSASCAQAILVFRTNAPNTPTSVYAQGCPI